MIPVQPQPEPENFIERVKVPGEQFLNQTPHPTSQQWKGKEFWRCVLPDARKAYEGICAYSAHWIPHSTGSHSIDHFIPKSQKPRLAYTWSNFRYVSARFNSRKSTRSILDPFTILSGWFILNFGSFFIQPNPNLLSNQKEKIKETISILKFNTDEELVKERFSWYNNYKNGNISFDYLRRRAPFIAYELQRQNLINS